MQRYPFLTHWSLGNKISFHHHVCAPHDMHTIQLCERPSTPNNYIIIFGPARFLTHNLSTRTSCGAPYLSVRTIASGTLHAGHNPGKTIRRSTYMHPLCDLRATHLHGRWLLAGGLRLTCDHIYHGHMGSHSPSALPGAGWDNTEVCTHTYAWHTPTCHTMPDPQPVSTYISCAG